MSKLKQILKIIRYISAAILALVLVFNLTSTYKRIALKDQMPLVCGLGSAVVLTGSMEPVIMPGDMILIQNKASYDVGDIVTFRGNNYPITHRIIYEEDGDYVTKGDANNAQDDKISAFDIFGKVFIIIPKVGYFVEFLQKPFGMLIAIVALFLLFKLPDLIKALITKIKRSKKDEEAL